MMSIPYFVLLGGYVAAWAGWRALAIGLWAGGVAVMLVLFKIHATSSINIVL